MSLANKTSKIKFALVQLAVTCNKQDNVLKACELIAKAAEGGAQLVCLPECFNSPYGTQFFEKYAETIPGTTSEALSEVAKKHKIYLLGGTIPETENGKYYNTAMGFDPEGNLVMKYKKNHLFDIDIPGKIKFKESDILTAGKSLGILETSFGKIGVGICYDLRFPLLAHVYSQQENCDILVYPGAFNMTTGPLHWELLQKARAVDNQVFVASIAPARDMNASYVSFGHSMAVDPWGKVIVQAKDKEEIAEGEFDMEEIKNIRGQIPIRLQRRDDLFKVVSLI